jgi:hypothetical protein
MDGMGSECGYLVTARELSWTETVYYRCSPSLFWRLGAVFLWWEAFVGPVILTLFLKPLLCMGGMSPGLHCAHSAQLGFPLSEKKKCVECSISYVQHVFLLWG